MAPRINSTSSSTGFHASLSRFLSRSYLPDYIGLLLLTAIYLMIELLLPPFHAQFKISSLRISHPHALHERVSTVHNILLAGVLPLILLLILPALLPNPSFHKSHLTILGLLISLTLGAFLTDVIKNAIGRPRPDLLDRCKPAAGTPADTWVDWTVCTAPESHKLHDGWRSFPSGHSSFAFSGLGYLSLFLAGQFGIFRARRRRLQGGGGGVVGRRGGAGANLIAAIVAAAPLLGATLIAASRLQDYRHDRWDVGAGSVLGMLSAWWSYRRYFPRLRSPGSAEPYPVSTGEGIGIRKARDVEEGMGGGNQGGELDEDDFEIAGSDEDEDVEETVPLQSIDPRYSEAPAQRS